MKRKSCGRAGSDEHDLTDTRADRVDGDDVLLGELSALHELNLHKLASYQGFLLSR